MRNTVVPEGDSTMSREPRMLRAKTQPGDLQPAHPVADPAHDDDEDAGEQRRNADGQVAAGDIDAEICPHGGRNVKSRLGKQPEGNDPQNNAQQEPVSRDVCFRLMFLSDFQITWYLSQLFIFINIILLYTYDFIT